MPRRRHEERDSDAQDTVDLDAPEHAWWTGSAPPPGSEGEPDPDDPDDPYVVLKVAPSASWDDIVASYRRLARLWHPDNLRDPAPGERELCDDMIRRLNIAYTELRVRRGR